MYSFTVIHRVSNAKDRPADQWFITEITLPCPPPSESQVWIGGRCFYTDPLRFVANRERIVMELHAYHGTFHGEDFAKICEKLEAIGFKKITAKEAKAIYGGKP